MNELAEPVENAVGSSWYERGKNVQVCRVGREALLKAFAFYLSFL
jgi:hypothetical protein